MHLPIEIYSSTSNSLIIIGLDFNTYQGFFFFVLCTVIPGSFKELKYLKD